MTPKNTETNGVPGSPRSDRTDYFGPDSRPASPESARFGEDSGIGSDDCWSDDESTGGPMTVAPPPVEPVKLANFFSTWRFRTVLVSMRRG